MPSLLKMRLFEVLDEEGRLFSFHEVGSRTKRLWKGTYVESMGRCISLRRKKEEDGRDDNLRGMALCMMYVVHRLKST